MKGRWNKIGLIVTILVFACIANIAGTAIASPPSGATWTQTFNDDFNGTSLDTTKWDPNSWGIPANDSELQGYSPSEITVANGIATLRAEKKDINYHNSDGSAVVKHYTSGFMATERKWTQRYGYFESRLSWTKGRGLWPAFWTVADINHPSPSGGSVWPPEIDILEAWNGSSDTSGPSTYHTGNAYGVNYPSAGGGLSGWDNSYPSVSDPTSNYHTYGLDWEPGYMTFYLDGVAVYTTTNQTDHSNAMYMILNLAIDNPNPPDTNGPWYMYVDYVNAWQKSGSGGTTLSYPGIGSEYNPIYGGKWAGESFAAQGSSINSVSLWMQEANNADITVEVRSGSISGTVLGSTMITSRTMGKVSANFNTPINVTSGTTYYLKAYMNSGTAGRVQQTTATPSIQGYYEGGTSSADMAFELVFNGSSGGTTLSKPGIGSEYNPINGGKWAGESFAAQGSEINSVSLWMLQANNADITVEVRSGSISGTVLGSTTITSRTAGKVSANFGTPISVTNGTTYYLKAYMSSGSAGTVQQSATDSTIQGYYEGGTSSADMAFELVFN